MTEPHTFAMGTRVFERAYPNTLGTVVDHAPDGWTLVRWDQSRAVLSYSPSELQESRGDQLRIGGGGRIESEPLTWDGEPLYAPETVREGLFDPAAFEQIAGQLAIPDPDAGQLR